MADERSADGPGTNDSAGTSGPSEAGLQAARHAADLARLHLDAEALPRVAADLEHILEWVRLLEQVDADAGEDASRQGHDAPDDGPLRPDRAEPAPGEADAGAGGERGLRLTPEEAVRDAPDAADGFFRVPDVL